MKIKDTTVVHNLGLESFGGGANIVAADILDGKIARIRPVHFDEDYTKEELNYWTLAGKNGTTFEPGMKSYTPPFPLVYKRRTYSKNRIPYPMKRVDWDPEGERNPQNRGTSKYERISWDEACRIIAAEIKRVHDTYGPNSILCQGDGHGESKAINTPHGCMTRLLANCGGYTAQARNPDSWEGWYWGAKHVWGMDPVGQNTHSTGTAQDIAQHCDAMLYWGCDLETTTWGWGGQLASRMAYWFDDCDIMHIAVAPDCNYTAAVHADKWFPVLPNTDAALQLAIAYTWWAEGTYDREYIDTPCHRIRLVRILSVGLRGRHCENAGVGRADLRHTCLPHPCAGALLAQHAVSIAHCNGGSFVRAAFAHEPARLEVYLLAMQGIGKPGAISIKFIEWVLFGLSSCSPLPVSKVVPNTAACYNGPLIGQDPDSFVPKVMVHKALRGESFDWYGHGTAADSRANQFEHFHFPQEGDAGIKMLWSDNPSFTTSLNGGYEFQSALRTENLEFYLVEAPWVRRRRAIRRYRPAHLHQVRGGRLRHGQRLGPVEFGHLRKGRHRACGRGAVRLGSRPQNCQGTRNLRRPLRKPRIPHERRQDGGTADQGGLRGVRHSGEEERDFEAFKKRGYQLIPTREDWREEEVGLTGFYEDPERNRLETPSGKIEFYSSALATAWPDDHVRGPVAHWVESGDGHDDRLSSKRAEAYPFLIVSNHPRWRVHAELDDVEWLREIETCKSLAPTGMPTSPCGSIPSMPGSWALQTVTLPACTTSGEPSWAACA